MSGSQEERKNRSTEGLRGASTPAGAVGKTFLVPEVSGN